MTKIDFHILPTDDTQSTYSYVARLVQKALSRNHRILIATESEQQSKDVSQALWSHKPDSFLAHTPIDSNDYAVQISSNGDCGEHHDVLINLCEQSPAYFSRFGRVFEVVSQQPALLQASRQRYRDYKDNGYPLDKHDLRPAIPS